MKKSLIYYLSQIKEAYPEITDIKKEEFDKISAEINAQIQAGQPVTAHRQLFGKTYRFLKILANFYAENGIDYRSFNDNLSALQLKIMAKLDNKVAQKEWFLNFGSYVSAVSQYFYKFMDHYQKESTTQKKLNAKLVENILSDELMKQVYEKELKNVENNELKAFILEALDTLSPREVKFILEYYGLNGNRAHTMDEIGSNYRFSREYIRQTLHKALVKLRHPQRSKNLYEIYKYDSD